MVLAASIMAHNDNSGAGGVSSPDHYHSEGEERKLDLSTLSPEAQRRAAYLVNQLGLLSGPKSVPNYSAIGGANGGCGDDAASSSAASSSGDGYQRSDRALSASLPSTRKNTNRASLIFCIHGNRYGIGTCCDLPPAVDPADVIKRDKVLMAESRIDMGGAVGGGEEEKGEGVGDGGDGGGGAGVERTDSSSDLHCHDPGVPRGVDKKARNKLFFALTLCIFFMTLEFVGGLLANSLAIMTDAFHLLSDFAAFLISLIAIHLAARPASAKYNYGWHRMEVVGAVISVLIIWVLTGGLLAMAVIRLVHQDWDDIDAKIMLITSSIGVVVNIIMGFSLHGGHGHSHGGGGHGHAHAHGGADGGSNINVRAAMIHVIGDFIQSVGVLVAALIIFFIPSTGYLDPVCTILFSLIVLYTTFNILREVFTVLMEAMPRGVDFFVVKQTFLGVEGIKTVHDLRVWALTTEKFALSAHLVIEPGTDAQEVLKMATLRIREKYRFQNITLQVENYAETMEDCKQCENP